MTDVLSNLKDVERMAELHLRAAEGRLREAEKAVRDAEATLIAARSRRQQYEGIAA